MPLLQTPSPTSPSEAPGRRILFLDAYDSFSNNIVSLLKDALGHDVSVHVLHMDLKTLHLDPSPDWTTDEFLARLPTFDAVVCGPGPGSPLCDADVGAFRLLWGLPRESAVPVLGICLGFQSLVAHLGGGVRKLRTGGLHGMVRPIEHLGQDIFRGVPPFRATLYHSLGADVGQDDVLDDEWEDRMWLPPVGASDLVPLAWTVERGDWGEERILMAARHAKMPFWGIQYHPESVCTDPGAHAVIKNWFSQALKWNLSTGRVLRRPDNSEWTDSLSPRALIQPKRWWRELETGIAASDMASTHHVRRITLPDGVDAADVAEVLGLGGEDSVLLDSSSTITGDPLARNSIIALDVDKALRFEYHVGDDYLTLVREGQQQRICIDDGDDHGPYDVWSVVSDYWQRRLAPSQGDDAPTFSAGFMGFVTYEMGLGALSPGIIPKNDRGHHRPDLCFAWVTKSIVLDHQAGVAYVQAMAASMSDAESWIDNVADKLQSSAAWKCPGWDTQKYECGSAGKMRTNEALYQQVQESRGRLRFKTPDPDKYEEDVRQCQAAIREGHSYELCLTGQTTMTRPLGNDVPHHLQGASSHGKGDGTPWTLFRTLRARQPAPFGSFIRLGGATIISSSPERFLSHDARGLCSMRPMKGTVRKSEAVSTLAQAEKLLHIPKEEAENLMIVDLVRHDLHGVCGAGAVSVPDLLKVEEYASVFQMVTAVNGLLPQPGPSGLDVLAAALPPGSMTGAPKKRSCELLRAIEGATTERSVYSGVVGYVDVRGRGDWSVTIRTMFRWDDERAPGEEGEEEGREVWRLGAGGAVTTLSTAEGEREEMFTKLCGPLGVLMDTA